MKILMYRIVFVVKMVLFLWLVILGGIIFEMVIYSKFDMGVSRFNLMLFVCVEDKVYKMFLNFLFLVFY